MSCVYNVSVLLCMWSHWTCTGQLTSALCLFRSYYYHAKPLLKHSMEQLYAYGRALQNGRDLFRLHWTSTYLVSPNLNIQTISRFALPSAWMSARSMLVSATIEDWEICLTLGMVLFDNETSILYIWVWETSLQYAEVEMKFVFKPSEIHLWNK